MSDDAKAPKQAPQVAYTDTLVRTLENQSRITDDYRQKALLSQIISAVTEVLDPVGYAASIKRIQAEVDDAKAAPPGGPSPPSDVGEATDNDGEATDNDGDPASVVMTRMVEYISDLAEHILQPLNDYQFGNITEAQEDALYSILSISATRDDIHNALFK